VLENDKEYIHEYVFDYLLYISKYFFAKNDKLRVQKGITPCLVAAPGHKAKIAKKNRKKKVNQESNPLNNEEFIFYNYEDEILMKVICRS
jgi:hypothetical protein